MSGGFDVRRLGPPGDLLSAPAATLMDHHSSFHRVLSALSLQTGRPYIDCYSGYTSAVTRGASTVYEACEQAGARNLDAFADDLHTLQRAEEAKNELGRRALRTLASADATDPRRHAGEGTAQPQGDAREQGIPVDNSTYSEIREQHPKPVWSRLRRARKLPGGGQYAGEIGERRFADEDLLHAQAGDGTDMVATAEQGASRSRAAQVVAAQSRRMDDAIAKGEDPPMRRRLLAQAIRDGTRTLDQELLGVGAPRPSGRSTRQGALIELDDGGKADDIDAIIAQSRRLRGADR